MGWADALQGLGEGLAGRGPAYMAAQARQQEAEALSAAAQRKRQTELQRRIAQTNRVSMLRLANGDIDGAIDAYGSAYSEARDESGINEKPVMDIMQQLQIAKGRPELMQSVISQMQGIDQEAQVMFGLAPIGGKSPHASAKTHVWDNGTSMQTRSDGSIEVYAPGGGRVTGEEAKAILQKARQEQVSHAGAVAGAKTESAGEASRAQDVINYGRDAANGLPIIKRSLHLLNLVDTGGIDAAKLKAKQWFGIETADEAELTSNLGKAVLSQLKATFGAQFTEKEGQRLEWIEANLGKSQAGNRRILQQLQTMSEKYIDQAIKRASDTGDYATVDELMEMKEFTLDTPAALTGGEASSDGWGIVK